MTGPVSTLSPDALARACADAMWASDEASQGLGMAIEAIAPGSATLSMTVTHDMTNGHKTCHGGFIFTLADSAFAFACNSYNERAVAQHCSISYLRPGKKGDVLTARACERQKAGRSGLYDVAVSNQDGVVLAEFRGHSRLISGHHRPDLVETDAKAALSSESS